MTPRDRTGAHCVRLEIAWEIESERMMDRLSENGWEHLTEPKKGWLLGLQWETESERTTDCKREHEWEHLMERLWVHL